MQKYSMLSLINGHIQKYWVNIHMCGDITKEYLYFIALTVLLNMVFVFHFILKILTFNILII